MSHSLSRKHRGFTLTELSIVLGIIGLVLAGIWEAASMAYFNMRLNKTVQQLATIVSNTRALYSMGGNMVQPNFTDITANMVGAGVFPSDMPLVAGIPYNVFGGQIKMESQGNCGGPFTLGSCDATTFEVEFFPPAGGQNPCAAFITRIIGSGRDPGLMAVYDNIDGWRDPINIFPTNIDPTCTYVSLAYRLHI